MKKLELPEVSYIEEGYISFYPDYAGIGLSMTFVFDNRTGEMIEEGEMQD